MEKDPIPITERITDQCSKDTDMGCAVSDDEHSTDDYSYEDQDLRSDAVDDKEHSAQEYESESNEELDSSMVCLDEYF